MTDPEQLELVIQDGELIPPDAVTESDVYGNDCPHGRCEA